MLKTARTLSRARLANSTPITPPSLLFKSCTIGPSKDFELSPSSAFSTSSRSYNNVRTKPSKAERHEKLAKLERKRSLRALKKEKEKAREANAELIAQRRVQDVKQKVVLGQQVAESLPPLTEQQLEAMYRGLLAAEPQELAMASIEAPNVQLLPQSATTDNTSRQDRLTRLSERLDILEEGQLPAEEVDSTEGEELLNQQEKQNLAELLKKRRGKTEESVEEGGEVEVANDVAESASTSRKLLRRLQNFLPVEEELEEGDGSSEGISKGVVVKAEWRDLILSLAEEEDLEGVESTLKLMQRFTPVSDGEVIAQVLALYSEKGKSKDALKLAHFAGENSLPLSVVAHHHLLSSLLPAHPTLAIQHIHSLETAGHTPLLETYTLLIRHLVAPLSPPHLVSRGWDLYAHTRLVSHPTPSPELYSTMIMACSRGTTPAPERAMDLFTEMTEDNGLPPNEEAFNGLIRACARHGSIENYHEALRFMRRMLDDNIRPSRKTLHAVLEGSRKHGDLARARWILVKMVEVGGSDIAPNAETLALVLQAYAAYKPPIRQGGRVPAKERKVEVSEVDSRPLATETDEVTSQPESEQHSTTRSVESEQDALLQLLGESSLMYPGPLPQTSDELLNEAYHLMAQCVDPQILRSSSSSAADATPPLPPSMFSQVDATSSVFLLNSYLTLLTRHGPFDSSVHFFNKAFSELGVEKNRNSFEIMMSRCETANNRQVGTEFAKGLFEEWEAWRKENESARSVGSSISFMWASLIRVLARNFEDLKALSLLQNFISLYPPSNLPKSAQSSRQSHRDLPSQPSLIRLSSPLFPETSPLDRHRPPYLQFSDVKLLHMRLANVEDKKGLAVVKGVCKAYEGALREAKDIEEGRTNWRNKKRGKGERDMDRDAEVDN